MKHVTVKTKDASRFAQDIYDLLSGPKYVVAPGVVWGLPGMGKTAALTLLDNDKDVATGAGTTGRL